MRYGNTIKSLLQEGENQKVEFKKSFGKETIISAVSFANTKGGKIIVGVEDDGTVIGLNINSETIQNWTNEIKVKTNPGIIVGMQIEIIQTKKIVVIIVDEFPIKPVSFQGRYYKLIKNSNHKMDLNEIANSYLKTFNLSWDSYIYPGYESESIDIKKVEKFIAEVKRTDRFDIGNNSSDVLAKLKFIKDDKPTAASLLLFAKEPLMYNIHIGRFRTPSVIIDDKQVCDTLFEATEKTMKIIKNNIKVAFEFTGNVKRSEIFEYPIIAIREAVLNAIVHRDYTVPGDIQIKIFDDKITIYNPGKLYNLSIEDLQKDDYQSQLRNVLIAEAFYLTKNIEKYGSGLIRIRKELENYDDISFCIEEKTGGVLVVFKKTTPKTTPKNSSEIEKQIIELIKQNKKISKAELGNVLGLTEDGIKYHIRKMTEKKMLKWEGTPRNGYWKLVASS